jgi:hypothetical protein
MKSLFLSIVLLSVLCSTNQVQSFLPEIKQVDSATVTFKFVAPDHCPDSLSRNPVFIDTVDTFLIYYGCSGVYKVLDSAGIDSIFKSFDMQLTIPETIILPIGTTIRFYWDVTVYFKNKAGSLNMNRIRHEYFYTVEKDDHVVIDGRY